MLACGFASHQAQPHRNGALGKGRRDRRWRRLLSHRLPLPSPPYLRARPWQVHLTLGAPSPASAGASPMLPRAQMVQTINVAA